MSSNGRMPKYMSLRRRMAETVTDNRPALTHQPCSSHPSRTPKCRTQHFFKKALSSVTLASPTSSPLNLHHRPTDSYEPGTVLNYQSAEARFKGRVGLEVDIWAFGCAIFEIHVGFALSFRFLFFAFSIFI